MAVLFRIVHTNHSGGTISIHTPIGGSLRWSYHANNAGDIAYSLALSDPTVTRDSFGPYYTDWRLGMNPNGAGWEALSAGIHVPVGLVSDADTVDVAGVDWSHWLEQPVWFDIYEYQINEVISGTNAFKALVKSYNNAFNTTTGFADTLAGKAWAPPATQEDIITHLINTLDRGPNYINIVPIFHTGGNEVPGPYVVMVQDETTVLEHINTICNMNDPFGFDWTMHWNKQMHLFGPRKNVASSPSPIWTLTASTLPNPMELLDWTNNGPLATWITGVGEGSPAVWRQRFHTESMNRYRQWHKIVRVGEGYLRTPEQIRYLTAGLKYIAPQKDLKLTIRPEDVNPSDPGDGFRNHVGDVIRVTFDFPNYHLVDAYFWITDQEYSDDAAGNWKCELGLQQIYT